MNRLLSVASSSATRTGWNRKILFAGGACMIGGLAVYLYIHRSKSKVLAAASDPCRPTASVAPLPVYGLKGSQQMKERGNQFFKNKLYDHAIAAFTEAIALCPQGEHKHLAICYQNRAAAHDRLNHTKESYEDCTAALKYDPKYVKAVLRRAKAAFSMGRAEEALDDLMFSAVITPGVAITDELNQDTEEVVKDLATKYIADLKITRESIPVRDENILMWQSCSPNDPILIDMKNTALPESLYRKALEDIKYRKYDNVIPLLEEELDSPHLTNLEKLRDEILIVRFSLFSENIKKMEDHLNRLDLVWNAMSDDEKDQVINKRFRATYYLLSAALKLLSDDISFSKEVERAISIDDSNMDAYISGALLFAESNQHNLANDYLDRLLSLDPKHLIARHMKLNFEVVAKESAGDFSGALTCIQQIDEMLHQCENTAPILYMVTGRLFYGARNKEFAISAFKKAVELFPDFSTPLFSLAVLEAEDNPNLSDLEKKMYVCLEKEKNNPDALTVLAKIAAQRQDFEKSLVLYEQCIQMYPARQKIESILSAVVNYIETRSLQKAVDRISKISSG